MTYVCTCGWTGETSERRYHIDRVHLDEAKKALLARSYGKPAPPVVFHTITPATNQEDSP